MLALSIGRRQQAAVMNPTQFFALVYSYWMKLMLGMSSQDTISTGSFRYHGSSRKKEEIKQKQSNTYISQKKLISKRHASSTMRKEKKL